MNFTLIADEEKPSIKTPYSSQELIDKMDLCISKGDGEEFMHWLELHEEYCDCVCDIIS